MAAISFGSCIPKPQPISDERKNFDRSSFRENILTSAPQMMYSNRAVFGGKIQLIGMNTEPRVAMPGSRLTVSLYFRVLEIIDEDWQLFIHMDPFGGFSERLHGDHYPVDGKYHTGFWQKGEIVKDTFRIWVPGDYNADKIATWIGFYIEDTRMPVDVSDKTVIQDGQNRVNAGMIPVASK